MNRKIIPYNPKLKELARKLRNNPTKSELVLWQHLKGKQLLGYDFDRQKPINNYIFDFFCYDLMLGIELHGYTHQFKQIVKKDEIEQKKLESIGINILYFKDQDVLNNTSEIITEIEQYIKKVKID